VEYYRDASFGDLAKKSVTPLIDFDLGIERGTGSPDASAGVPQENFSTRWTGSILPPAKGAYKFYVDGDGQVRLWVNGKLLVDQKSPGSGELAKKIKLTGGQPVAVKVEYVHATGDPHLNISWSGPSFAKTRLTPVNSASGN
jgi:hypothetical protein